GDCREMLRTLPGRSVQCVVTSPPYYGLRSYVPANDPRKACEIGLESRPDCLAWARGEPPCAECYVCTMRVVFREVWRVLRDDGVLWLNPGDTYSGSWGADRKSTRLNSSHVKISYAFICLNKKIKNYTK